MSRLYASIQGARNERTCRGHREMYAHVRGWKSGIRVLAGSTKERGDFFQVFRTTGSDGSPSDDQLVYELNGEQGTHHT